MKGTDTLSNHIIPHHEPLHSQSKNI
ncbi:hypothetical protein ACJDU8_07025 [Clostridium sp. WILCCON 0269]|uniref:Uncharacterized protein n=1 Tax=Candidatus Clostridium eludens TaxID=3381663 RepID=A0ABW8SHY8_9CLOT